MTVSLQSLSKLRDIPGASNRRKPWKGIYTAISTSAGQRPRIMGERSISADDWRITRSLGTYYTGSVRVSRGSVGMELLHVYFVFRACYVYILQWETAPISTLNNRC